MTISAISPEPQLELLFCSDFEKLRLDKSRNEKLAVLLSVDGLEKQPQILDPEILYKLLSKLGLAFPGLLTPKAELIDMKDDESGNSFMEAALERPQKRPLLFDLKLQQTLAGFGTYRVKNEEDRKKTLEESFFTVLPILMDLVTHIYRHLDPASLVIRGFVKSNGSMSIAFFIKQSAEQY
jgi:hypothetical protein